MKGARWLGLLLALTLAPAGCAHQTGARAPGEDLGRPAAVPGEASAAPAEEFGDAASADSGLDDFDDLEDEDDLDSLDAPSAPVADPLAPWNRAMFSFNDKLYFWVLKPVSRAYRTAVPRLARIGVENFFNNLATPIRFVSNALQFKGREASIELGKFMINSTWGVLGFGNLFAGNPEAKIPEADLGLLLARYGVGGGPFIIWPFIGPYTLRDSIGWAGEVFIDPISYIEPTEAALGVLAYSKVNATSFRIGDYESLKDASIDPYLALRDAYLQNRAAKIRK